MSSDWWLAIIRRKPSEPPVSTATLPASSPRTEQSQIHLESQLLDTRVKLPQTVVAGAVRRPVQPLLPEEWPEDVVG